MLHEKNSFTVFSIRNNGQLSKINYHRHNLRGTSTPQASCKYMKQKILLLTTHCSTWGKNTNGNSSSISTYSKPPFLYASKMFQFPLHPSLSSPTTPFGDGLLLVRPESDSRKGRSLAVCCHSSAECVLAILTFLSFIALESRIETTFWVTVGLFCLKYSQSGGYPK